ncbi:AAA family ATPase [bacterium]|nr:AAA family ATPase [bacterium]
MKELPIGIQDFEMLRRDNLLYVDKTERLLELVKKGRRYFLSRPRRFGKSLTLSTLEAMFEGRAELFAGLAAEEWVKKQAEKPLPVLRFDMSAREAGTAAALRDSLKIMTARSARHFEIELVGDMLNDMLAELLEGLYKRYGGAVVLIDEYDKPILDHIADVNMANSMREVLRSFYTALKSCDKYLRFVFITGISKFSKVGVFSAMNNLLDISLTEQYGDLTGYTQRELEAYFEEWISFTAEKKKLSRSEILENLKEYYDGFSFDGETRLYNPYSILSYFATGDLNNYWYESGSPSFIVEWMKAHQIQDPEEYRHKVVKNDFISSQEIENADPASFLFQSGYLTIEKRQGPLLTLDFPNREVIDSISRQIKDRGYAAGYCRQGRKVAAAVLVADAEKRQVVVDRV